MGRYEKDIECVASRTMVLFYLLDTSGSMDGNKIGQVNYAMKDIPKIVREAGESSPNADIKMVAATFDSDVNWITQKPLSPDEFERIWRDVSTGGLTSLGAMLDELNEKLSRKAFLGENAMGYLAPAIIIMSDGVPSDEWEKALKKLEGNNWFKNAIKIAFAVGEDADRDVLARICGSSEAVIQIDAPEKIRNYIKFVTATVSKTGTTSQTSMNQTAQEATIEKIQNADNDDPVIVDISNIDDEQW